VSASQINLSWTASTDPDNTAAQLSYGVYRNGARVATTAAGAATWNDTGLSAATTYTYAVSARDPAGNSSAQSATVQATTAAAPAQPYPSRHRRITRRYRAHGRSQLMRLLLSALPESSFSLTVRISACRSRRPLTPRFGIQPRRPAVRMY
jgi:hypothetical protein